MAYIDRRRPSFLRFPSENLRSLSFPLVYSLLLHRKNSFERSLGWAVVIGGFIGIFCSGSRGGWVGVLWSLAVFVAIWSICKAVKKGPVWARDRWFGRRRLVCRCYRLIIVWPKAHDMVLGGGAEAGSTEARYIQWAIATPFIKSNPITGHGFVLGGYIIKARSTATSYRSSSRRESPDLYFSPGCSCFRSGTA